MTEFLKFHANGQWSLHKALSPQAPKTDYQPGSGQYKVYGGSTMDGALHVDNGMKGSLRNFNGGKRPKNTFSWKKVGKPSRMAASVYNERNPGVGD